MGRDEAINIERHSSLLKIREGTAFEWNLSFWSNPTFEDPLLFALGNLRKKTANLFNPAVERADQVFRMHDKSKSFHVLTANIRLRFGQS